MPKTEDKSTRNHSVTLQITLSAVALLLGIFLTFVPDLTVRMLCNVFAILLSAAGLVTVIYYFLSGAWKRSDDYNFAFGVLLLILGVCGLIRVDSMAGRFQGYMGFLILLIGIFSLQNTVQLRVANHSLWLPVLVLSLLTLLFGIIITLEVDFLWSWLHYWMLILSGAFGLVSLVMTLLSFRFGVKKPGASDAPLAAAEDPKNDSGAASE